MQKIVLLILNLITLSGCAVFTEEHAMEKRRKAAQIRTQKWGGYYKDSDAYWMTKKVEEDAKKGGYEKMINDMKNASTEEEVIVKIRVEK